MSFIEPILTRLFPSPPCPAISLGGLNYSGKTTLTYLLKDNEVINAIPTIGINFEQIDKSTGLLKLSGKRAPFRVIDLGLGCAGGGSLLGFVVIHVEQSDVFVWLVDSCDSEWLEDSVNNLEKTPVALESNKNIPVLILATKIDKTGAMPISTITTAFARVLKGRISAVFQASLVGPERRSCPGLIQAFDWISTVLDISTKGNDAVENQSKKPAMERKGDQSNKLAEWIGRVESDIPAEEFLSKFHSFELPSWDHYTHVRLAYIILSGYGRQKGKDMLFDGIERYIAATSHETRRTFHLSMTYFWIQMVHLGIRNMPPGSQPAEGNSTFPTSDDFLRFLLINPFVTDGSLWTKYYSKDVLMSAKAKVEMVLPDIKPLPTLKGPVA